MVGYAHNWTEFDELLPYEIKLLDKVEYGGSAWNGQRLAIIEKATQRVIYQFDRNYHSHGKDAFYQFKWEGHWYAVFGPAYLSMAIIDLQSGEIVCQYKPEKYASWCPVNFYVPSYYRDTTKPSFTHGEKSFYINWADSEVRTRGEDKVEPNVEFLHYFPVLFMCGVFWAADYEWLVYRLDLESIMKNKAFPVDLDFKNNYCFEFDYGASPSAMRDFMKLELETSKSPDGDIAEMHPRIFYYTQKYTAEFFADKKGEEEAA